MWLYFMKKDKGGIIERKTSLGVESTCKKSVEMIEWGFQRLLVNVSEFDYKAINVLSCMTLDVENCHSTVHIKQANLSVLE